jgi:hypothetical protein
MLASANMLAPKSQVKSCLEGSNPLSSRQMSERPTTVHEMQLFKSKAQKACVCERSKVRIWRIS